MTRKPPTKKNRGRPAKPPRQMDAVIEACRTAGIKVGRKRAARMVARAQLVEEAHPLSPDTAERVGDELLERSTLEVDARGRVVQVLPDDAMPHILQQRAKADGDLLTASRATADELEDLPLSARKDRARLTQRVARLKKQHQRHRGRQKT